MVQGSTLTVRLDGAGTDGTAGGAGHSKEIAARLTFQLGDAPAPTSMNHESMCAGKVLAREIPVESAEEIEAAWHRNRHKRTTPVELDDTWWRA